MRKGRVKVKVNAIHLLPQKVTQIVFKIIQTPINTAIRLTIVDDRTVDTIATNTEIVMPEDPNTTRIIIIETIIHRNGSGMSSLHD